MYGLVNKAISDLVIERFGVELWNEISVKCGAPNEFELLKPYGEELTYQLVSEISQKTGLASEELLFEFGKYWILFTGTNGYEGIMEMFGNDIITFLSNLNHMHSRMGSLMPNLVPPSFEVLSDNGNKITLNYLSQRSGLTPMAQGMLVGLAEKFNKKVKIDQKENSYRKANSKYVVDVIFEIEILGEF